MTRNLFVLMLFFASTADAQVNATHARAHLLVYKTRADYNDKVPVALSDNGKKIASYPDPVDIRAIGDGALPVVLHKGYLLSRYGVGKHIAFLKLTLAQYAALKAAPTPEDIYKLILTRSPLTELYDCGIANDPDSVIKDLNRIIDHRLLRKKCKGIDFPLPSVKHL